MGKKRTIISLLVVLLVAFTTEICFAALPYPSYTYNYDGDPVASPSPYVPKKIITGAMLGIGDFKEPADIFVTREHEIYLLDSGNGRIICTDAQWGNVKVMDTFSFEGKEEKLNKPQGLFVTQNKEIYVADTDNKRIVKMDTEGKILKIFGVPDTDMIDKGIDYLPMKIVVDKSMRMYIAVRNVNMGLVELDNEGNFLSFIGAPKVSTNPFLVFWKALATKEQKAGMRQFVPTEYNNIAMDEQGFIYGTISALKIGDLLDTIFNRDLSGKTAPVRRLNATGQDVLRRRGHYAPVGDIDISYMGSSEGPSTIVDAAPGKYGIYSILDGKRGRIFAYDLDGNLLFVFGGSGIQDGTFRTPTAIDMLDSDYLVVDSGLSRVTQFGRTEYGKAVIDAVSYHYNGKYDLASQTWEQVLKYNSNFDQAYIGIGKAKLRNGDYSGAMENFKIAYGKSYYSKAFKLFRKEAIGDKFALLFGLVVLLLCSIWIIRLVISIRKLFKKSKKGALRA